MVEGGQQRHDVTATEAPEIAIRSAGTRRCPFGGCQLFFRTGSGGSSRHADNDAGLARPGADLRYTDPAPSEVVAWDGTSIGSPLGAF